jgi:hypothetical protein
VTVAAATVLAVMATACTDDGGEAGGPARGGVAAAD